MTVTYCEEVGDVTGSGDAEWEVAVLGQLVKDRHVAHVLTLKRVTPKAMVPPALLSAAWPLRVQGLFSDEHMEFLTLSLNPWLSSLDPSPGSPWTWNTLYM